MIFYTFTPLYELELTGLSFGILKVRQISSRPDTDDRDDER